MTILHCPPSIITRQRASVNSKWLCRPRNVGTPHLNDNAQTPLNRFAVYMLYSQLCNKYSGKSNTWNLGLSLSEATSAVGAINSCPPSATLCIAAHQVALIIFSNSTVVHIKNGSREQNHAPFRGDLSSIWQDLILSPFIQKFQSSSFSHS